MVKTQRCGRSNPGSSPGQGMNVCKGYMCVVLCFEVSWYKAGMFRPVYCFEKDAEIQISMQDNTKG